MSEQKTIDTLTVCRICNQAINFGPPIIGENDQARTLRMMATLHRHLEKYHLQHFKEIIREATCKCSLTTSPPRPPAPSPKP
jgi:hypothetical protein